MIQAKTIDGVLLRDMVVAGAALLEKHREAVDALNAFAVPDGDTGTNKRSEERRVGKECRSRRSPYH